MGVVVVCPHMEWRAILEACEERRGGGVVVLLFPCDLEFLLGAFLNFSFLSFSFSFSFFFYGLMIFMSWISMNDNDETSIKVPRFRRNK